MSSDSLAAHIASQHLASRPFTHVAWTEDKIAEILEDDLQASPLCLSSDAVGVDIERLLEDIPEGRKEDPLDDALERSDRVQKAVDGMQALMSHGMRKADIRDAMRKAGRRKKGGKNEYGGDVHPYPRSAHPIAPPIMSRKSERALPRLGSLAAHEKLTRPEQLLATDGPFGFVQRIPVNELKKVDIDEEKASGQDIVVDPPLLRVAKAWRKPFLIRYLHALQAHDHPVEMMPRWAEWDVKSAQKIKEATVVPRVPLLPLQRSYRPSRHIYGVKRVEVPALDATQAKEQVATMIAVLVDEVAANGETPWDDLEVPAGLAELTMDPDLRHEQMRRQRTAKEVLRMHRQMRLADQESKQRKQWPSTHPQDDPSYKHHPAYAGSHAGSNVNRYLYQHPISSPTTSYHSPSDHRYRSGPFLGHPASHRMQMHPGTDVLPAGNVPDPALISRPAPAKRKKWDHTEDLRQLALRRKMSRPDDVAIAPRQPTGHTKDGHFDARAHLEEQEYLRTGISAEQAKAMEQAEKEDTPIRAMLYEPELDPEETNAAREAQHLAQWKAAQEAPREPEQTDDTPLNNPDWYAKACYIARKSGKDPLNVLASLRLFQYRSLLPAFETKQLELLDEEAYLGGADLVPWATVGVLFRCLSDLQDGEAYKEVAQAVKAAVLYYERVILVFEVKPYAEESAKEQGKELLLRMEQVEDEEEDHLQSVREPNTPRRPTAASAHSAKTSVSTSAAVAGAERKSMVAYPTRRALSGLKRTIATIQGQHGITKIASKVDIVYAHNGAAEVAGAIRAIAEYEEKRRTGGIGTDRAWLSAKDEQNGDEAALVNVFHINPFAARLVLGRHRPFRTFMRDNADGVVQKELEPLIGKAASERFIKLYAEQRRIGEERKRQQQASQQQVHHHQQQHPPQYGPVAHQDINYSQQLFNGTNQRPAHQIPGPGPTHQGHTTPHSMQVHYTDTSLYSPQDMAAQHAQWSAAYSPMYPGRYASTSSSTGYQR